MTLTNMLGFEPDQRTDRAPRAWPRFMTARVAADYSDSSPWTIRRHVRPCGRRGRTFVYAIEAIEEWMRGGPSSARRNEAPRSKPRTSARTGACEQVRDLSNGGSVVEPGREHVAA